MVSSPISLRDMAAIFFFSAVTFGASAAAHAEEGAFPCETSERHVYRVGSGYFYLSCSSVKSAYFSLNDEPAISELVGTPNRVMSSSLEEARPFFGFSRLSKNRSAGALDFDGLSGVGTFNHGNLAMFLEARSPGERETSISCSRTGGYLNDPETAFGQCHINIGIPEEDAMLHVSFLNPPHDRIADLVELAVRLFEKFHVK